MLASEYEDMRAYPLDKMMPAEIAAAAARLWRWSEQVPAWDANARTTHNIAKMLLRLVQSGWDEQKLKGITVGLVYDAMLFAWLDAVTELDGVWPLNDAGPVTGRSLDWPHGQASPNPIFTRLLHQRHCVDQSCRWRDEVYD